MSNENSHYKVKVDVLGEAMRCVDHVDDLITKAMLLEKKTPVGVSDELNVMGELAGDLYNLIRDYRNAVKILARHEK
jgi:hypothetical protein